jgi:hypothetical protein
VLATEATSKYTIIARRFGSTGSVHGIPPNLVGIMTQKGTIRNGLMMKAGPSKSRKDLLDLAPGRGKTGLEDRKDLSGECWRKDLRLPPSQT